VDPLVFLLVAGAAVLHVTWNVLLKTAGDPLRAAAIGMGTAALVICPLAVVIWLATGRPEVPTWTIALSVVSGTLEALYFAFLAAAYRRGDLSLVYPLARGTGPLLSGAAAIIFLGERPSALAVVGALIIIGAVFSLVGRHGTREAIVFAVLTGVAIASYTLWDKHAVGPSELSPVVYYWGTNLTVVLILTPWVLRRGVPGGADLKRAAGVGLLSPLAYVLILYALARAPVSYVAPARESSIVVGTLLGALVLHEKDMGRRLVAAAAILLGVVVLTLG
jgi:drug/metabolite transporter (DMT)-like permease